MSLLLYPQVVLLLWGPLLVFAVAWATRSWRQRLAPRDGFRVSLGLVMLPTLIWFVPYLPVLPLREWLPYRVPIAWGIHNIPPELAAHHALWWLLSLPVVIALFSMALAALYGIAETTTASWKVRRLPHEQQQGVTILNVAGQVAFAVGVLRPRVCLSRSVWEGPHCAAILAHEHAHLQSNHGLWLWLARWSRRSLWYWLPAGRLLEEVTLWAELVADEASSKQVGTPALARALSASLSNSSAPVSTLPFASATPIMVRVQMLMSPTSPLPRWLVCILGLLYALFLIFV